MEDMDHQQLHEETVRTFEEVQALMGRAAKLLHDHGRLLVELAQHNVALTRRIEVLEGRMESLEHRTGGR